MVEATPSGHTTGAAELDGDFSVLRGRAAMAGIRIVIETVQDGIRFAWHVPVQ